MRNTLGDLNNHLFEQLERLNDDDLVGDKLEEEIKRSSAIARIASSIIENANVVLTAKKVYAEFLSGEEPMPKMLEG